MAYNHQLNFDFTLDESLRFWLKRVKQVWPLHAMVLTLSLILTLLSGNVRISDILPTYAIFLSMQHAWFPKIALTTALSGASWYLSALAFCWLMTPAIAYVIVLFRKLRVTQGSNLRASFAAAMFFYGCRVILELMLRTTSVFAGLSLHSNPFVRMLEYATAYAAGNVLFEHGPLASKEGKEAQAIIELIASAIVPILWIRFDETWWRCTFFALSLLLTLSPCCGQSLISKVLSSKALEEASKYELCFYLFHQLGIRIASSSVVAGSLPFSYGPKKRFVVSLLVTMLLSVLWTQASHSFVRKQPSRS